LLFLQFRILQISSISFFTPSWTAANLLVFSSEQVNHLSLPDLYHYQTSDRNMANQVKGKRQEEPKLDIEHSGEESQGGIVAFLEENTRLLIIVAGVVVLLVGGVAAYRYSQGEKDAEAQAEMFQAVRYFESDSLSLALNGDGTYLGLLDIVDEYDGTPAANMSRYYAGVIYLKQGDTDNGVSYLEDVSTGDNMLSMATYAALAFAYEDLQDPGKAADLFEKAAYTPEENQETTPTFLLKAGENYEAAGEPESALKLYQKIKSDFPNSPEARGIDKYIGRASS
jgi:tetratricopeptide (TPR) repeat protein